MVLDIGGLQELLDRSAERLCDALLQRDVPGAGIITELDALHDSFVARMRMWGSREGRA